jgi:hypothetical protein
MGDLQGCSTPHGLRPVDTARTAKRRYGGVLRLVSRKHTLGDVFVCVVSDRKARVMHTQVQTWHVVTTASGLAPSGRI